MLCWPPVAPVAAAHCPCCPLSPLCCPHAGGRRSATSGCEAAYADASSPTGLRSVKADSFYCCCVPRHDTTGLAYEWASWRSVLGCSGISSALDAAADGVCTAVSADGTKKYVGWRRYRAAWRCAVYEASARAAELAPQQHLCVPSAFDFMYN